MPTTEDIANNTTENTARIDPIRLGLESSFQFACHPGVKCFTQCCRGINILLTPYDIIRLKHRLKLESQDFLAIYTRPELLEKTDLPVVTLKQMDDEAKSCPFVRDDGCIVYSDRPTICRYYPLGVATLSHKPEADDDGFYFFVHEPHCLGFEEPKDWTVSTWRQDQGVDQHDEINDGWTDLLVRKRSFPKNIQLTEKSKQMFFMVSYNVDRFRDFVFNSGFLTHQTIAPDLLETMRTPDLEGDIALMRYGVNWLQGLLFKAPDGVRSSVIAG